MASMSAGEVDGVEVKLNKWHVAFDQTVENTEQNDKLGSLDEVVHKKTRKVSRKQKGRRLSYRSMNLEVNVVSSNNFVIAYLRTPLKLRSIEETESVLQFFDNLRYFEQVPLYVTRTLVRYARYVRRVRHELIAEQGSGANSIFVLINGTMVLYHKKNYVSNNTNTQTLSTPREQDDDDPEEIQLSDEIRSSNALARLGFYGTRGEVLTSGSSFGELSMQHSKVYPVSLVADSNCDLMVVGRNFWDQTTIASTRPFILTRTCLDILQKSPLERDYLPMSPLVAALQSHPLFCRVAQGVLESVSKKLVLQTYPPGHLLMREGDPGDFLIFIVSGSVSLHSNTKEVPKGEKQRKFEAKGGVARVLAERERKKRTFDQEWLQSKCGKLWKFVWSALTGPVFTGRLHTDDPEASPYTCEASQVPSLHQDLQLGRPLDPAEPIQRVYGPCHAISRSGTSLGGKELCIGQRKEYTAITREPVQVLMFDHVMHAQLLKSSLSQTIVEPRFALRTLLQKPTIMRTTDMASNLLEHMRENAFFKNLPESGITKILMSGLYRKTQQHEVLFQQSDMADRFYVILSGKITIHVTKDPDKLQEIRRRGLIRFVVNTFVKASYGHLKMDDANLPHWVSFFESHLLRDNCEADYLYGSAIRRLETGASFGELGMTSDGPSEKQVHWKQRKAGRRGATIVSDTPAEFLTLTCEEYHRLVKEYVEENCYNGQIPVLKRVPLFRKAAVPVLKCFATWMVGKQFPAGAEIAHMDDSPTNLFFIKEGTCKVVFNPITNPWREEVRKAAAGASTSRPLQVEPTEAQVTQDCAPTLGPGTCFGAFEHISDQSAYTKSLIAQTYTEVFQVEARAFIQELERQQQAIKGGINQFMTWAFESNKVLKKRRIKAILALIEDLVERSKTNDRDTNQSIKKYQAGDTKKITSHLLPRHHTYEGVSDVDPRYRFHCDEEFYPPECSSALSTPLKSRRTTIHMGEETSRFEMPEGCHLSLPFLPHVPPPRHSSPRHTSYGEDSLPITPYSNRNSLTRSPRQMSYRTSPQQIYTPERSDVSSEFMSIMPRTAPPRLKTATQQSKAESPTGLKRWLKSVSAKKSIRFQVETYVFEESNHANTELPTLVKGRRHSYMRTSS